MSSRAAIYLRVSTAHQAEKYSLPAQRRILRELAERNAWTIVREYEDAGISGETIDARPAFRELLAAAAAGEFDVLLVIDLDRLSRSQDLHAWAEISGTLRDASVRLVTPSQEIDFRDEDDSFLGALFALLSGREKQKILKRTRRGLEQAVREGRWIGGTSPFGYRYDKNSRRLEVNPEEAPAIPLIFELYVAGQTYLGICRELKRRGVRTRSGARWYPQTIRQILRRPVYTGFVAWNRTDQTAANHRDRPPSQWVWSEEPAHEALVPRPVWEAAQVAMRQRGAAVNQPSYLESPFLLTGLLRCWCGERMAGHSTVRRRADGSVRKHYRRYRCQGHQVGEPEHRTIGAEKLEAEVLEHVKALATSPAMLERARKRILLERMRSNTRAGKDLDELRQELAEIQRKQGVLYGDRLEGRVTVEQWERFNGELLAREEEISGRLEREEKALLAGGGGPADVSVVLEVLRDFDRIFEALEMPQRKALLRAVVQGAQLTEGGSPEVRLRADWTVDSGSQQDLGSRLSSSAG